MNGKKTFTQSINSFLDKNLGIKIIKSKLYRDCESTLSQSRIFPNATYSPWMDDHDFKDIHKLAKHNTLVDQYRLYNLYSLAKQYADIGGIFLEVGVWRGGSSAIIQKAISMNKNRKKCDLVIADTFEGVVKADKEYDSLYRGGEHSDAKIEDVLDLFTKAKLEKPRILKGIFPDDHDRVIEKGIVFLHSDVDTYKSTKDLVEWAIPRLAKNAILVFDDYGFQACEGVTKYCNELRLNKEFIFNYNLNSQAIFIKSNF